MNEPVDQTVWDQTYDMEDERSWLQTHILFKESVLPNGLVELSERTAGNHMRFFTDLIPGSERHYTWCPMWRLAQNDRHLDEVTFKITAGGDHLIEFNRKPAHGSWCYNDPATPGLCLDVKFNCRFGEPGNTDSCTDGKWGRFQRVPGTESWLRLEMGQDLNWVILMSPIV